MPRKKQPAKDADSPLTPQTINAPDAEAQTLNKEVILISENKNEMKRPSEHVDTATVQPSMSNDSEGLLLAIKNMLDEHDKTLPATIRNEVTKMVNEAKQAAQQPQQQIQPQQNYPVMEQPPTMPVTNGIGGALAQNLPTLLPQIMQMIGGANPASEMQQQLLNAVMQAGMRNLTLGGDFLNAITNMVAKNIGVATAQQVSTQVVGQPAVTTG
jgi:hypothetical protein